MVTWGRGVVNGEFVFNGTFEEDEKVLETDGGDGCTTVWMNLMLLNCALKMVKFTHPVIYILSQVVFSF